MPTCLFCQVQLTKANRSKEHAIPRWIVRRLECEEEGYLSQELTYPKVPNEVLTQQVQSINSIVLGHVCTACNGGWMSALEVRTTPLLEALWKPMSPTILTTEQCLTIAKWTFKTAATVSYASDYKKIIPRQHIYDFFTTQCLPANSTVDLAYCAGGDRLIQSLLGGDKRFAIRDPNVTEEELKDTYVITLHFGHVMLRLGWAPVAGIKSQPVPKDAVYRIFPATEQDLPVRLVKGRMFRDHFQFHFFAIFSEDGLFDNHVDTAPQGTLRSRYVVWNGVTEIKYTEDDRHHDCMITAAGELVSVQKRRRQVLAAGHIPTVIFACARGQTAVKTAGGGVFTRCWLEVTTADPHVTFRDAVRRVNQAIGRQGLRQICEVVCREDALDTAASGTSIEGAAHVVMVFDMCRNDAGLRGEIH